MPFLTLQWVPVSCLYHSYRLVLDRLRASGAHSLAAALDDLRTFLWKSRCTPATVPLGTASSGLMHWLLPVAPWSMFGAAWSWLTAAADSSSVCRCETCLDGNHRTSIA